MVKSVKITVLEKDLRKAINSREAINIDLIVMHTHTKKIRWV